MLINIAKSDTEALTVEIETDYSIDDIKALIEVQTGVPIVEQVLLFNGSLLKDADTVAKAGIQDGDVLQLHKKDSAHRDSALRVLGQYRSDPQFAASLQHTNPQLASALQQGDLEFIEHAVSSSERHHRQQREEQNKRLAL